MRKVVFVSTLILLTALAFLGQKYLKTKGIAPTSTTIGIKDERPTVNIGGMEVKVYVAKTPEEKAKGLSIKTGLDDNEGMLFVFEKDTYNSFWMKGMKFAIDIIWINDGKVTHISKSVPPPEPGTPDNELKLYSPSGPYDTVLEVNAGFSDRHNISIEDEIDLSAIE